MQPHKDEAPASSLAYIPNRRFGGWLDQKYFYMGITLSVLKLREFYRDVVLVGDSLAKEILIDQLNLPYTDVELTLDGLNYPPSMWAVGKLLAYRGARTPFIHVDGDLMIWEKLPAFNPKKKQLLFQNFEFDDSYATVLKQMQCTYDYLPDEFLQFMQRGASVTSLNAGLLGTNDPDFLAEYTEKALRFVDLNVDRIRQTKDQSLNMMYEQLLCYLIAEERKIDLVPYYNFNRHNIVEVMEHSQLNAFIQVPHEVKLIHLMGDSKRQQLDCYQLEQRLIYEYPAYHRKVLDLVESTQLTNAI